MGVWISIAALIVGILAIILAIMSYLDTKKIRQEFDSSLGTPAIEVRWDNPNEAGSLPCRVTAQFNRVTAVSLTVRKETKSVAELARSGWKDLEFRAVPEGTKFKLSFTDPVGHRNYGRKGIIRYGQVDF